MTNSLQLKEKYDVKFTTAIRFVTIISIIKNWEFFNLENFNAGKTQYSQISRGALSNFPYIFLIKILELCENYQLETLFLYLLYSSSNNYQPLFFFYLYVCLDFDTI